VLGMLYVGMPESPFLAVRTDVMLTFLFVALAGMAVVLVLTYVMTRSMIHPLEDIVAATKKIAGGDLNLTVAVTSRDEIGHLATSFNRMLQSLRAMQEELQQWGHTLEEKVRERSEELVAVQARMTQSEKLASIGRLAAGVAHEINNPLGGILSLAMLGLEEGGPENPLRGDLEIIVKQTLRCREIVKGLLDFARQSEMRPTRTDVNAIVDNTLKLLERQAIFHNIKTVRQFREPLPAVLIDPGQMQEVVMNIVINAVDAMEENGELTIETEVDERTIEVVVRIRDTGSGIPNDVMPFIFEPFFTTKKVGKGTGLGLAIVHGIVTRAGGRVEVKSSHEGTTFTVRLPIATEEAEHVERESVGAGPG
jgi:two-component system NtrC family sensor kinase